MNAYQARAFIEQVLSSPNIYLAQALVDSNLAYLDATFFQVLEAMIQEADNRGQFGSNMFSPNMPGIVADYIIDNHAQADQRAEGLRMLYQYAASRQQQTNAAPSSGPTSQESTQLIVTCNGCGSTYPVMCPGYGMHMPAATVASTPQGGVCTMCGAPFTFVTCMCGAVTNLGGQHTQAAATPYAAAMQAPAAPSADSSPPDFSSYLNQSEANPPQSSPVEANPFQDAFRELRNQFDKERGQMDDARQTGLDSLLERLGSVIDSDKPGKSLEEMTRDRGKLDDLMAEMLTKIKKPTLAGPSLAAGSRAEKVFQLLQDLKTFIGAESMKTQKADGETNATMDLFLRLGHLTTYIHQTQGDETKLLALETDQARQLVNEVRQFARRRYITLAQPVWSRGAVPVDPNLIFFSGRNDVRRLLEGAAHARQLEVNPAAHVGREFDEARWQDLRAASLAVFDISTKSPQVFYELGIALVLGTELLIVASDHATIPFDVAQEVHTFTGLDDLRDFFSARLDDSLYGLQSTGADGSSLATTIAYAERLTTRAGDSGVTHVALDSLRKVATDPCAVGPALKLLNSQLNDYAQMILYPRWPGCYAEPAAPRCFIVMPFDKKLDPAYRFIEQMCAKAKPEVAAVRGDVADEGEIIKSIWEEIGRATHVTVDLTGFNPNVCLELGIANALGRNTLLVGREGTDKKLKEMLPNVAKRRCHTYPADPAGKPLFVREVGKFLAKNTFAAGV